MSLPEWLHFFERPFPSANMVLIRTEQPVLIDSGFGADFGRTTQLLRQAGVEPEALKLVLNSHYHCDHVGGNHHFQQQYGVPNAAHLIEANEVNCRSKDACDAEWLGQPIEPYEVDYLLADGDEIDAGGVRIQVLHTPIHSLGHLSFYLPDEQILIAGDTIHRRDVAWLNLFRRNEDIFEITSKVIERLRRLPVRWACSGHGKAITDPAATFKRAQERYERWSRDLHKVGWHACKRLLAYGLMMCNGMTEEVLHSYLLESPWYQNYTQIIFEVEPKAFIAPLLDEMLRSRAAKWQNGRLVAVMFHHPVPEGWADAQLYPIKWEAAKGIGKRFRSD